MTSVMRQSLAIQFLLVFLLGLCTASQFQTFRLKLPLARRYGFQKNDKILFLVRGGGDDYRYSSSSSSSQQDYYYNDYGGQRNERYEDEEYMENNDGGYYDESRDYKSPSPRRSANASLSKLKAILRHGDRKIGFVLLGAGFVFTMLGMSLFFNKSLMRLGNLAFIAGVPITIGPGRTAGYFLQPKKSRATICLVAGIFLVLVGWPILGICLELFGLLNLFGNMFPVLLAIVKQMPVIGPLLKGGGGGGRREQSSSSRRNRYDYEEDQRNDYREEGRYYDDDDDDQRYGGDQYYSQRYS